MHMRLMGDAEIASRRRVRKAYAKAQLQLQMASNQRVVDLPKICALRNTSHEWDCSHRFWDTALQAATDTQRFVESSRRPFVNTYLVPFVISRAHHNIDLAVAVQVCKRCDLELIRRPGFGFRFRIKLTIH